MDGGRFVFLNGDGIGRRRSRQNVFLHLDFTTYVVHPRRRVLNRERTPRGVFHQIRIGQGRGERDLGEFRVPVIPHPGGIAAVSRSDLENTMQVSHAVRQLAVDLRVVMIGLSQLNRETVKGRTTPQPQGLMGGSPLENDADQVVLLNHAKYKRTPTGATTELLVAKNRHGPQVRVPVVWDYGTLKLRQETHDFDEINREDRSP